MATKKPKNSIDDFKDRMTSPVKVTRIDPKTRKPLKPIKPSKKKGK